MGLAIYALSKLDDGTPYEEWLATSDTEYPEKDGEFLFSENMRDVQDEYFPGRAEPLIGNTVYQTDPNNCEYFSMGAYSSYGGFRSLLEDFDNEVLGNDSSFWKIIEFSDCEGFIGSVVSEELYQDFTAHRDDFLEYLRKYYGDDDEYIDYYMGKYDNLIEATNIARDDGAMMFC